jgi:signal transduction histidine kinase
MIADSKNPISAAEREEFAANIRVSIKRLSNLITDLLAYSKIRAENLEHATVTVQALIDPLLLEMRGRFPLLRVHVKAPNEIHAYKSLLQTLFQNLMENTLKYARRDDVEIFVDQLGSTLTYRDNGPGIPVTDRERVFDLFHRREQDRDVAGAGIGLAICKKVMALHGGTIELLPSESGALFQMKFENTQGKNPPGEPLPPSPNSPP